MKVEEWAWITVFLTVIGVVVYVADTKAPNIYDKRNWVCAEYDVDIDADEQVCIRLERAANK